MTNFVMNEIEQAEKILDREKVKNSQMGTTIPLLAKYFCQVEGMNKTECYDEIVKFMKKAAPDYFREADQMFYIDKCIGYAQNIKLIEIENIKITNNEMDIITSIKSKPLERLAFVMLCCCKYHMLARNGTSHWVNYEHSDIFRMARLTNGLTRNEKYFYDLCQMGLLECSHITGRCSLKVNYVDESENPDIALVLNDMRELAYEYQNYVGDGHFIRCKECGVIVKVSAKDHSTCRCKQCQNVESQRLAAERKRKQRAKNDMSRSQNSENTPQTQ